VKILHDVIAHTNDKLLRVVCILTTIPITRNSINRISLTNIDGETQNIQRIIGTNIVYVISSLITFSFIL